MKDLVIFGAGGFGREVHQIVEDINAEKPVWNFIGFLDQDSQKHGNRVHEFPILGDLHWLSTHSNTYVVISIGDPAARRNTALAIATINHQKQATLIHPNAHMGSRISVGTGSIIHSGVSATTDIQIGQHVILNKNSVVAHDVTIDDFVFVAPGAFVGAKHVGQGCYLGANCTVINYRDIGAWSIIGAGSVVTKDVPSRVTVIGVPARIIKRKDFTE